MVTCARVLDLIKTGFVATLLGGFSISLKAEEILVAVASNFSATAKQLESQFEASSGHHLTLVYGSTGQQYAQIINGAPFDVFLAADAERPELLERSGHAIAGSRFTYALGRLVLWKSQPGSVDENSLMNLATSDKLAIANPKLAPYGVAAEEVFQGLGIADLIKPNLVLGENVGQTFLFVASGAAKFGFISLAQVQNLPLTARGSIWIVDESLYHPIRQQTVLLRETAAAIQFMDYLKSTAAQKIILASGYALEQN